MSTSGTINIQHQSSVTWRVIMLDSRYWTLISDQISRVVIMGIMVAEEVRRSHAWPLVTTTSSLYNS